LKDAEKDRLALKNSRSRLKALQSELVALRKQQKGLEGSFESLEEDKMKLYDQFEETVRAVQRRAEYRNTALESKLDELQASFDDKTHALEEALRAAKLDPAAVSAVAGRINMMLDERNAQIQQLQLAIAQVSKAHNDTARAFRGKADALGVPEAADGMALLPAGTSLAPAGLVAKAATETLA
jgi:DNA repair exonuclease SbcCD ATPase subunit